MEFKRDFIGAHVFQAANLGGQQFKHPLDYFCGKRTEGVTFSITAEDQEELKEQEIQKSERMLKYYKGSTTSNVLNVSSSGIGHASSQFNATDGGEASTAGNL
ncbi:hypothetical protein ACET3Z_010112 [Daucus carota]